MQHPATPSTIALVLASGRGVRAGGGQPKQYRPVDGIPVLRRSLEAFLSHPRIAAVRAVIHPDDHELYAAATAGLDLLPPVEGGATRQISGRNGLESLVDLAPAAVMIHDAARPFVSASIIDRLLDALLEVPAAIAAVPVSDTLKRGDAEDAVAGTVDRAGLWRAQTPQGFRFSEILAAHRRFVGAGLTDDAAVAERAGLPVRLVLGAEDNIKVTTPEDFARAERLARSGPRDSANARPNASGEFRMGSGFDVHRFGSGDHVFLCGIQVPHTHGLIGHSDADVGLHAITDAILGAAGAGDIGQHFPPTDPKWRGADSAQFLAHSVDLVRQAGGTLVNLDVTLICERPKIGPHREAMRGRVAAITGLSPDRVNVKGTTTEQLGFTGRREGIAAQAVATIRI